MSPKQTRKRERSQPHAQARRSVLVVDDEAGTVDVLMAVLNDADYDVVGAAHGRDALAKLGQCVPDLVLLDLMMPVLDGAQTLQAIKSDARYASLRVVMMSGIPESMVKRRCRGYDAFMRKPFSLDELLGTVTKILGRAT